MSESVSAGRGPRCSCCGGSSANKICENCLGWMTRDVLRPGAWNSPAKPEPDLALLGQIASTAINLAGGDPETDISYTTAGDILCRLQVHGYRTPVIVSFGGDEPCITCFVARLPEDQPFARSRLYELITEWNWAHFMARRVSPIQLYAADDTVVLAGAIPGHDVESFGRALEWSFRLMASLLPMLVEELIEKNGALALDSDATNLDS